MQPECEFGSECSHLSSGYILQEDYDQAFDVNNEMANRMSLFYAHATPLMKMLSDTTSRFVSEVSTIQCIISLL